MSRKNFCEYSISVETTAQQKPSYQLSQDELFSSLQTSEKGLTAPEALERLKKYGANALTAKKKISALQIYIDQFKNTLTLILIGSTFLILFIYFFGQKESSDLVEAGLILAIVILVTLLGFIQEFKAEKAVESLKKLLAFKARVMRDSQEIEIDVKELVVGDLVILEEGTKVPADIRLIESFSLRVSEASLTGESTPVGKTVEAIADTKQINDQKNMLFAGTAISSGRGIGVVVATGDRTEIGKIAGFVAESDDDETPIQKRLEEIGKMLGYIILGICGVVFIFIMFFAKDFAGQSFLEKLIHSFIAAVALAVAAIPEGLPAVVTISLALGTQRMLKKNALVRKLNSVETLGSTDVICSDKTGTLTKGEMTVTNIYANNITYSVTGTGYEKVGALQIEGKDVSFDEIKKLLQVGLECNNSSFTQEGNLLGDSTEGALLVSAAKAGITSKSKRVLEIPFSSERKMMSVIVEDGDGYLMCTKGAPEILLAKCNKILSNESESQLSEEMQTQIGEKNKELSQKALRNLGIAYKKLTKEEFESINKDEPEKAEENLVFIGIQGMIDPARDDVKQLIEDLHTSGIRVIMITGDHIETAKAVASQIGIKGEALSGLELDAMSEEAFIEAVESISVYARVNPGSKMRIVDALKKRGHIVAMTGDGVNDAPALKKADIGIAMGITGTDVAKEASDMVLLDDHFSTIVAAIKEGRGIFHNIRKFVYYLLSCNMAEVMIVFLAIIIFQDVPLTATMLLWINVVTDGIPAVALGLDEPEKNIMLHPPKAFQAQIVTKRHWLEMTLVGILITIATLIIYVVNFPSGIVEAKAAAFTAIVVFELIQLFLIRSQYKLAFFSNKWLMIAVVGTFALQLCVIYIEPIAKLFEITEFDLINWAYIGIGSLLIAIFFKLIPSVLDALQRGKKTEVTENVIH